MPRRKKERSIYVTKEPQWNTLKLITDPIEQDKAFQSCEYFVRTEIPRKKIINACKLWIKEASGWTKEEIKIVLANPEWSFSAAGISTFVWYKLGYMPESVKAFYMGRRKEEWFSYHYG